MTCLPLFDTISEDGVLVYLTRKVCPALRVAVDRWDARMENAVEGVPDDAGGMLSRI